MRIGELSRSSGASVPTIKYYLREGLLNPGTRTGPNQASYGDDHLRRLRLIGALSEVGNLSIATIREVLEAIDDPKLSLHEVLGTAHRALGPDVEDDESEELRVARQEVDNFISELGWSVGSNSPARRELAQALVTLRRLGWEVGAHIFDRYARLADRIAGWELSQTPTNRDREETVEAAVVWNGYLRVGASSSAKTGPGKPLRKTISYSYCSRPSPKSDVSPPQGAPSRQG